MLDNFGPFACEVIEFPLTEGLRMLTGENKVDLRLGANGVGKTFIWEAICFAFYGTGVKGKKLSSLVSWEQKTSAITVVIDINGTRYTIARYGPPMKVELDKKLVEQKDIDQLIGLSKERFLHSVIFGQGVKLFPDLPVSERVDLFDEVLDLSIWSKCLDTATQRCNTLEKQLNQLRIDRAFVDGRVGVLESEECLRKQIIEWEDEREEEIVKVQEQLSTWDREKERKIKEVNDQVEEWKESILVTAHSLEQQIEKLELNETELKRKPDLSKKIIQLENEIAECNELISINDKLSAQGALRYQQVVEEEKFWSNNACPSCGRLIDEGEKLLKLKDIQGKKLDFQIATNNATKKTHETITKKEKINSELNQLRRDNQRDELELHSVTTEINKLKKQGKDLLKLHDEGQHPFVRQLTHLSVEANPYVYEIQRIREKKNPHEDRLQFVIKEKEILLEKQKELGDLQIKLDSEFMAVTYWKSGFKRIRLFYVQQVLNALEIETKAELAAHGLEKWKVRLATESETKSGTIKLGVQIHISAPTSPECTIEAFSGGESQRLRLAIAKGLGNLIQRAAGTWWNVEVWDEPTAHLSGEGIEDLLDALQYRSETQHKQIWLVDHRALTYSGFKEIWSVVKDENGSKVKKISEAE